MRCSTRLLKTFRIWQAANMIMLYCAAFIVCWEMPISNRIACRKLWPSIVGFSKGIRMERSLVILKPDAVQRGLVGTLIGRLEARGLKIVGMKLMQIDDALARRHYAVHEGKPFFAGLVQYIVSGPVVVLVVTGKSVISTVRTMVGATNPVNAAP